MKKYQSSRCKEVPITPLFDGDVEEVRKLLCAPERVEVLSSHIKSVGYNDETETLDVEFRHGGVYRYTEVPKEVADAFLQAPSPGRYLANHIKNVYCAVKLV